MRKTFTFLLLFSVILSSCGQQPEKNSATAQDEKQYSLKNIDTAGINGFFVKFPMFEKQKSEVKERYKTNGSFIWFDQNGIIDFAGVLYNQAINISDEGLSVDLPYREKLEQIVYSDGAPDSESELLLSCLYFFYTDKVFKGLDKEKSREAQWFLPRENKSYAALLDSLVKNPKLLLDGQQLFMPQYYNLRLALKKYRDIEKIGGWKKIAALPGNTTFKSGDTSMVLTQIRERLFVEGYIKNNSSLPVYDDVLIEGITNYYQRHNRNPENAINNALISELNVPVENRIKTIIVNMERCRWISPKISSAPEFIAVNIPSYRVHLIRKGKPVFSSKVVVGTNMNKTVVFSGQLSNIVFSPYWNVPNSILEKEIRPAIQKNPNYLAAHNMEWHNGRVRQKPGANNSLGLVKFMFPNSNNIYLHDTPAKSLFAKEERAFSHGCIRVEKARELAVQLMSDDADWTEQQVDNKMHAGKESSYNLRKPIPVYIGYFTAWADIDGNVAFYKDIYNRDERLLEMLHY